MCCHGFRAKKVKCTQWYVLIIFTCSSELSSSTKNVAHKLNLIQSKAFERRRWQAPYNSYGSTVTIEKG